MLYSHKTFFVYFMKIPFSSNNQIYFETDM